MEKYENKEQLILMIEKSYDLFVNEFTSISNEDIHKRVDAVDKTPSEMIAYQIGWLKLVLSWEQDEMLGKEVITPMPGIKWNQLGKLYQSFYDTYTNDSLETLLRKFKEAKEKLVNLISTLDEQVLFGSNQRKWAYTKAEWPVYKWIHINTVAPFKSFRSKIRRWKKEIS